MSERMEEDLMDDLGFDDADGAAEMDALEGFDEFESDEFESADEADLGEEDEWESADEDLYEEGFEEEGFEDYGEESDSGSEDAMEDAMAYALGADGADEFFRRIRRRLRRIGGVVGRVARVAAPIASLIPHPAAQAAAKGLGLLGKLRAEGASEEDAMDAFAEYAAQDESAIPIAAGIAARNVVRGRGAGLPMPVRRALVRGMITAARTLAQRTSPVAIRAIPRIVRSVRRTAAVRRTPVRALPRVVARTAANVARNPRLARRLSRPITTPAAVRARRVVGGMPAAGLAGRGIPRILNLRGPVRITISRA